MTLREIIIIVHNIRSAYNVGSIIRTAEGFGIKKIIISGYSPYPALQNDERLPHEITKINNLIHKTALGAENLIDFEYQQFPDLDSLKRSGYEIVGLEQSPNSQKIQNFKSTSNLVLIVGEEINGISETLLNQCDSIIEIPMFGKKESFNVSVATGIALYALRLGH